MASSGDDALLLHADSVDVLVEGGDSTHPVESDYSSDDALASQCSDSAQRRNEEEERAIEFEFCMMSERWLNEVKDLHFECFPVRYNDTFFKSLLHMGKPYFTLLLYALYNDDTSGEPVQKLVGVCTWKVSDTDRNQSYIATFGVTSDFRRRGLGSGLLGRCLECISSVSKKPVSQIQVSLHVLQSNHGAISLYRRHGFVVTRDLPNHYTFNDRKHHAFEMRLEPGLDSDLVSIEDCAGFVGKSHNNDDDHHHSVVSDSGSTLITDSTDPLNNNSNNHDSSDINDGSDSSANPVLFSLVTDYCVLL